MQHHWMAARLQAQGIKTDGAATNKHTQSTKGDRLQVICEEIGP